jgi:ATP-dependent helicase/DNAse subunit B
VVKRMVDQILDYDAKIAPLTVLAVEGEYEVQFPLNSGKSVFLGGSIDRLDQLGEGIRVIDYKSGGDEVKFPDVPSLFDREHKDRNGAAMQTLLYAYLYFKSTGVPEGKSLVPGLYNGKGLFTTDFSEKLRMGKEELTNALPLMNEFEEGMQAVLSEIFESPQPFEQTDKLEVCQYCPYKSICNR